MIRKHKCVHLLLLLHTKALPAPFFLTLLHLWNRWPAAGDRSDDVLIDLWRGFVIPSQPPPPTYLCAATVVCCQTSPLEAGPSYLWQPIVILHNQAFLNKPSLDALYHLLDTRWCDSFASSNCFFSQCFASWSSRTLFLALKNLPKPHFYCYLLPAKKFYDLVES